MRHYGSFPKISFLGISLLDVALGISALFCSCSDSGDTSSDKNQQIPEIVEEVWDFNNLDGWYYMHQDTASIEQWAICDGTLRLTTRANTYDRSKVHTTCKEYTAGEFTWRTFIPEITVGEQVSIGSWIYHDDHHELDFEVGSGTDAVRKGLGVEPGELVACMTNQDFPYKSGYTAITPGWHDFAIRLDVRENGNYKATWIIDGVTKQELNLDFGPEYGFCSSCSVENLKFIGDKIPATTYTGIFDRATFKGAKTIPTTD